jgi:DNA-binding beta-propeller fold protein YncE
VAAAVALGVGDSNQPDTAATTPTPTPTPTKAPPKGLSLAKSLTIGKRPNVIRIAGDNVFIGSFRRTRMRIVSLATGKPLAASPKVGLGVNDGAVGFGSLWLAVARDNQLVRLDAETGKVQDVISFPYSLMSVVVSKGAVWADMVPGNGAPDVLLKIDPKTGQTLKSVPYPYGIISMTASPNALWVAARRRARIQSVDLETGQVTRTLQVGRNRSEDIAYHRGAVWAATPLDDQVYKIPAGGGPVIPISVGREPRQLTISHGTVYVTNYSSSDVYTIDEKRSRVVGEPFELPANPYSIAADARGASLWIGSQPDNKVSKLLTGRAG